MKKNIFKMILPVAVIALATAGAFESNAMSKKKALVNETGWYHLSATEPCISSTMCSLAPGSVCTVNGIPGAQQLFRKGTAANDCAFVLRQPEPEN